MPVYFQQDPEEPGFVQNPYKTYEKMRTRGPAFIWEEYGILCFHQFEDVNAILRDKRFGREILHIASREELGWALLPEHLKPFYQFEQLSLLDREPPGHTRLRRLINKAFVGRAIERIRPRIQTICADLIGDFPQGEPFDLIEAYCEPLPLTIICELLGAPLDMAETMLQWSHDMVAIYQFSPSRETEDRTVRATQEFSSFMSEVIERKRENPGNDLISALIEAEDRHEKLSSDELIATSILLMNAGHEATVKLLANAVKALHEEKADVRTAFANERDCAASVEELFRFDAPLHLFTRYVLEDLIWGPHKLKKGQKIGLLLGAANRDPARFHQPEKLILNRPDPGHISLGAGIHFCVGAPLARAEIQEGLSSLFKQCPRLQIVEKPQYSNTYHFHGLQNLQVIL